MTEWKPIESAPNDGEHILLCSISYPWSIPAACHWFDGWWHLSVNQCGEHSKWLWGEPTHWMSLQHPPKQ